jgi:hypothetical protein
MHVAIGAREAGAEYKMSDCRRDRVVKGLVPLVTILLVLVKLIALPSSVAMFAVSENVDVPIVWSMSALTCVMKLLVGNGPPLRTITSKLSV